MKTFMVQASLMIVTYDRKNMFIVQATGLTKKFCMTELTFIHHPITTIMSVPLSVMEKNKGLSYKTYTLV